MNPKIFFSDSRARRTSLCDTALTISQTAYSQRKLIKLMEKMVVHNDGSVRCTSSKRTYEEAFVGCSATNLTAFLKKLKIAPTTLPTIAGNASTIFPASLLSASASLPNHFFKIPSSFGEEPPIPASPPKTPVIASTIVEIVIERAVSIENIVIPCSRKRVRILSAKDVF